MFIYYAAAGIIALLILWGILTYNGFVRNKIRVDNNFSQIDIQCKRRFDLVPNLVETVKGYASHERETLENVVRARTIGAAAGSPQGLASASEQLSETLARLFALAEAYPELKADANFARLQGELSALEKAIAVSRQFYNDSVMMYNRKILVFPNNLLARLLKFEKAGFFEATFEETQNVRVGF